MPDWLFDGILAEAKRRGITMSALVRQTMAVELHRERREKNEQR